MLKLFSISLTSLEAFKISTTTFYLVYIIRSKYKLFYAKSSELIPIVEF